MTGDVQVGREAWPMDGCVQRAGRRLAFTSVGEGEPVLWLHGSPSCRLEVRLLANRAANRGWRLVALDRPGIGGSDPRPGRTILDHVEDVRAVVDHLGIERFGVIGASGGGPYALACALKIPGRLDFAAVVAGAGPTAAGAQVAWIDRAARWTSEHFPGGLRAGLTATAWAGRWAGALPDRWLGPLWTRARSVEPNLPDARVLRDVVVETFRQGVAGAALDLSLMHAPWGFALEAIAAPVVFVQGTRDPFVPLPVARDMAAAVPGGHLHPLPGRGHLGAVTDLGAVAAAVSAARRAPAR